MNASWCLPCAYKCFGREDTSGREISAADGLCRGACECVFPDLLNIYERTLSVQELNLNVDSILFEHPAIQGLTFFVHCISWQIPLNFLLILCILGSFTLISPRGLVIYSNTFIVGGWLQSRCDKLWIWL